VREWSKSSRVLSVLRRTLVLEVVEQREPRKRR
jgi:hypothetical protein